MAQPVLYTWNNGAALAYQVVGENGPDLIYLPGVGSNLDWNWRFPAYARYLRRLAAFSRLIVVDRRGWGCSDRFPPGEVPATDLLVDDLVAVREASAGRPPALMAVNESGWLALAAAARRPHCFSRLILFGCSPVCSRRDDLPWEAPRERVESWQRAIARTYDMAEYVRLMIRDSQPSLAGDPEALDFLTALFRLTAGPGAAAAEVAAWTDVDLRAALPAIEVPTLVLCRRDDQYWPAASSRYLAEHIPQARLVELPGADGYPWVGDWEAVVGQVEEFLTGSRSVPDAERLLATVLFTDIVGSTEIAARLGDRQWNELLGRHHDTVRRLLVRHHGRELDTAGDGFFAVFDSPARALGCAGDLQREMAELGLGVRAGIHTGECEVVDGKPTGVAVAMGARLAAVAGPGEVLVSDTVEGLVRGSRLAFTDHGVHELKGLGQARIYALA